MHAVFTIKLPAIVVYGVGTAALYMLSLLAHILCHTVTVKLRMASAVRQRGSLALGMREEGNHPWLVEACEPSRCYGDAPPHTVPVQKQQKLRACVLQISLKTSTAALL